MRFYYNNSREIKSASVEILQQRFGLVFEFRTTTFRFVIFQPSLYLGSSSSPLLLGLFTPVKQPSTTETLCELTTTPQIIPISTSRVNDSCGLQRVPIQGMDRFPCLTNSKQNTLTRDRAIFPSRVSFDKRW